MEDNNKDKKLQPEITGDFSQYQPENKERDQEISDKTKKKKSEKVPTMVPIFSRRTGIVIGIGLLVGLAIALAYWILSPSISSSKGSSNAGNGESSGLIGLLGIEPKGPYESKIRIQVVNPGSEYLPLKNLQQMGEYYSAKTESLPFLSFLNDKLTKQMPGYTFTVDQLDNMITAEFDYQSVVPIIKISVVAPTEQEAIGLAELIPQDFKEYLAYEQSEIQKKQYDSIQREYDSVKNALYQAQQDLDSLKPQEELSTNPEYIALKSKVDTMQNLINTQAMSLVNQDIGSANVTAEYDAALNEMRIVSDKLQQATLELNSLKQTGQNIPSTQKITLDAKISALQAELDKLMMGTTTATTTTVGLAEMIAVGDTSSADYISTVKKVDTVSQALAEAKTQSQAIDAAPTSDNITNSAEFRVAQIKVDTLNSQLSLLQSEISNLYQQILNSDGGNNKPNAITVYNNLAIALAQAKEDLNDLENRLVNKRVSTDYQLAQDKVKNLNSRLDELSQQLGTLVGSNASSTEADYLVAGNPSVPSPILPARGRARNTLILGAIAGIIISWGVLNYKWIIKGMPASSNTNKPEGE